MARQALSANNRALVFLFLLFGCAPAEKQLGPALDMDGIKLQSVQGVVYKDETPFTGALYRLYPNGKDTAELKSFIGGKEHGLWKEFAPGGLLLSSRTFRDGKKEGLYEAWWENGAKRLEYRFENDEYEGNCKEWSDKGILIKNLNYKKGHEHGLQQHWDATGKLWANYEARNGRNYGIMGVKACATLWDKDSVSAR